MKKLSIILLLIELTSSCSSLSPNREVKYNIASTLSTYNEINSLRYKKKYRADLREDNKEDKKEIKYIQVYKGSTVGKIWENNINNIVQLMLKHVPKSKVNTLIRIKLENVPVSEFINSIFGQIIGVNYILDDSVKRVDKKITLNINEGIPLKKFLYLVLKLLYDYGIQPIYDRSSKIFKFQFSKEKQFVSIPIYVGTLPKDIDDDKVIMYIYPSKYIDLSKYYNFISRYIVGNYVTISLFDENKFLAALGRTETIRRLVAFLHFIDKPIFKQKNIAIIELSYMDASEFIKKITPILIKQGIPISKNPIEKGLFLYPLKHKVILISPKKCWIDVVARWKKLLDTADTVVSNGFYVYKPLNRNAAELAELLTKIKPNLGKNSKLTVVLDKTRNQLILSADTKVLRTILRLLKKLDTLPKQVLVETTIAEVTLKDQLQYGLEWYLKNGGYLKGEGGTLGALGLGVTGFTYSLITRTDKFKMILNAFAKNNLIKIISSPHLVVVNGKNASINVGTQVPVISSEVSAPDITNTGKTPSILRNVQYRNTGVQLSIQPSIISNDEVELNISQSVSDAQTNNLSSIDSPIILNRSISTDVVVKSGESVVLGGLISSNFSHTTNKVPVLGDVPVIGNLFKTESKGNTRTELIVIITPYILTSSQDYAKITADILKSLKKISMEFGSSLQK